VTFDHCKAIFLTGTMIFSQSILTSMKTMKTKQQSNNDELAIGANRAVFKPWPGRLLPGLGELEITCGVVRRALSWMRSAKR
jgi:hypothetical protein